uniref:Ovule protein n=1 Tax=Heterorhabditis bacteriophora TaxID=37862 RepID=A0A1I7XHA3_HETBA
MMVVSSSYCNYRSGEMKRSIFGIYKCTGRGTASPPSTLYISYKSSHNRNIRSTSNETISFATKPIAL